MAGMIFSREKNRVTVDAYALMIDEIRAIWEKDRTRIKDKATELISYVHLSSQIDPEAPFFSSKEDEVKALVAQNIWRNAPPRNLEQYDDTITAYQDVYETAGVRILKSFTLKIDEIKDLIDDEKPKIEENYNEKSGATTFATNIKIITSAMREINGLMDEQEKLEQRLKRQDLQAISTLGEKKPSRLEQRQMHA
jgi:hypothetical protein